MRHVATLGSVCSLLGLLAAGSVLAIHPHYDPNGVAVAIHPHYDPSGVAVAIYPHYDPSGVRAA